MSSPPPASSPCQPKGTKLKEVRFVLPPTTRFITPCLSSPSSANSDAAVVLDVDEPLNTELSPISAALSTFAHSLIPETHRLPSLFDMPGWTTLQFQFFPWLNARPSLSILARDGVVSCSPSSTRRAKTASTDPVHDTPAPLQPWIEPHNTALHGPPCIIELFADNNNLPSRAFGDILNFKDLLTNFEFDIGAKAPDAPEGKTFYRLLWRGREEQIPTVIEPAMPALITHATFYNCPLTVDDAYTILEAFGATLAFLAIERIVYDRSGSRLPPEYRMSLPSTGRRSFPKLKNLSLTSEVPLSKLFLRTKFPNVKNLALTLKGEGTKTNVAELARSMGEEWRAFLVGGDIVERKVDRLKKERSEVHVARI
ncbi:hypothetical protein CC1G_07835 [Coprinopsis cinerea okayama7|uniref:Uncharacterized protein n=1 Tax=Coprinopsis cinerea (strain Okayama-7 / 130 / ATCC MYA-4618 / FGSC 9003) TaxID=240176 RepID=A8P3Z9_COPC7|nr:hypothetical protein CC1G_07835 [Coprinopsis cinerea okayama7\|eukprot:XP_001838644.1 hypothetical protein CC1G_07835 [Coprinopsis cinerea okayama7\